LPFHDELNRLVSKIWTAVVGKLPIASNDTLYRQISWISVR